MAKAQRLQTLNMRLVASREQENLTGSLYYITYIITATHLEYLCCSYVKIRANRLLYVR
jgi:hypothetical protein